VKVESVNPEFKLVTIIFAFATAVCVIESETVPEITCGKVREPTNKIRITQILIMLLSIC
jgi:hypothetical protein